MGTVNYDIIFSYEPGAIKEMKCKVCDRAMDATMGKLVDTFICPDFRVKWHVKACALCVERDSTQSDSLKEIIGKDLERVLELKGG